MKITLHLDDLSLLIFFFFCKLRSRFEEARVVQVGVLKKKTADLLKQMILFNVLHAFNKQKIKLKKFIRIKQER